MHKLTDSVISLGSNSYKGSIECDTYLKSLESFNNIIFGINGCMVVNKLWTFIKYQPVDEVSNLN